MQKEKAGHMAERKILKIPIANKEAKAAAKQLKVRTVKFCSRHLQRKAGFTMKLDLLENAFRLEREIGSPKMSPAFALFESLLAELEYVVKGLEEALG